MACDPVHQPSESMLRRVRAQASKRVSPPVPTTASCGALDMKLTHQALYLFSLEFTCFRGWAQVQATVNVWRSEDNSQMLALAILT